jgi:hypothetical protein
MSAIETSAASSPQNRLPTLHHLTADTIEKIDEAIGEVIERAGFGSVMLVIDKGKLKWIQPAPSVPIN